MPAKLDNPKKSVLKSKFGATAPNDPDTIDRIKGLAIQPFIFDLCAVQGDITAHLQHTEFGNRTNYARDRAAAVGLDRALMDAGYSNRGNPYWVNRAKGEPTIPQIAAIADAARACQPMLGDRYMSMAKLLRSGDEKGRDDLQAYGARMQKFDAVIGEFGEMVADHAAHRAKQIVTSPTHICALE
jgi:hypothetical protein